MQRYGLQKPSTLAPAATMNNSGYSGYAPPSSNYAQTPAFRDSPAEVGTPRFGNAYYPPSKVLLDGYGDRQGADYLNGRAAKRPRSSALLNVNDPIAIHLLVETALGDSNAYEVLSFEEVEALKKERVQLASRIEGTRRKLALESKVRDAAQSLNRLYSGSKPAPNSPRLGRRSRDMKNEPLAKSGDELAASTRKCEELSRDLYQMENRSREVESRTLKHTAGILQMTHKGRTQRKHSGFPPQGMMPTGMVRPDSPASIFTYENGRLERSPMLEDPFDERSLYREPDNLDGLMDALKPQEKMQRLGRRTSSVSRETEVQKQALQSVGQKLQELGERVRAVIIEANPSQDYPFGPGFVPDAEPVSAVNQQLDYLTNGLNVVRTEQSALQQELEAQASRAPQGMDNQIEYLNGQVFNTISSFDDSSARGFPQPPIGAKGNFESRLNYLTNGVSKLTELQQSVMQDSRLRVNEQTEKAEKFEVVLSGLWDIILAGEEDSRARKAADRQARSRSNSNASQRDEDSGDESPEEDFDPNEKFSLPAFSTKVQWLVSQATYFKEKQTILRRQIKQQRALNKRVPSPDPSVEKEIERLRSEVERLEDLYGTAKDELREAERTLEALQKATEGMPSAQRAADMEREIQTLRQRETELLADLETRQDQVKNLESYISGAVEEERQTRKQVEDDLISSVKEKEAKIASLEAILTELRSTATMAESELATAELKSKEFSTQLEAKDEELRELEGRLVGLTTELTLAKAELDGAYGSRAERAAEAQKGQVAALTAELEAFKANAEQKDMLKQELTATLADFEELTRASVEAEREREELEGVCDKLREKVEQLEQGLQDERVKWLGVQAPQSPGQAAGGARETTTSVMRNEFKKMMRDTRAEHMKALKAEQEERRKLEQLVKTLKKDQGQGKSRLAS